MGLNPNVGGRDYGREDLGPLCSAALPRQQFALPGNDCRPYPPDGGLRPQIRCFDQTPSAFAVIADHFGFRKAPKPLQGDPGDETTHEPDFKPACLPEPELVVAGRCSR
jgi:hypothetical protein